MLTLPQAAPFLLPRLIFLNGPPGSGKTTLARLLQSLDTGNNTAVVDMLNPIIEIVDVLTGGDFGLEAEDYSDPEGRNHVITGSRVKIDDAIVKTNEFIVDLLGEQWFGKKAHDYYDGLTDLFTTFIFDNVRFPSDLWSFVKGNLPKGEAMLLHVARDGHEWSMNGGHYIRNDHIQRYTVVNNGTTDDLLTSTLRGLTSEVHA